MSKILAMSILFVSFLFCLFLRVRILRFFKDKLHSLKQQEIHSTWCKIYHIHTLISMILWGVINSTLISTTNKALTWPAQDPCKEMNVFVLEEVRWSGTVNISLSQTGLLHRCLIFWLLKHAQCIVLDHNKVVSIPVCLRSSLFVWTKVLDLLGMSDNAAVVFHSQALLGSLLWGQLKKWTMTPLCKTMIRKLWQIKQHLNGRPKTLTLHCILAGTVTYLKDGYLLFAEVVK